MSDSIKELAAALAKAQAEFKVADKNKKNKFFENHYADLQSVVEASRPSLSKHGFSVTQDLIVSDNGEELLMSILLHSSGQWIKSLAKVKPMKQDVQSFSSYVSYLKRISYASLVGVVAGEEDDDGELAVASTRQPQYNYQKKTTNQSGPITDDQVQQLEHELRGHEKIQTKVLDGLKIDHISQMPQDKFMYSINRIRELKSLLTQK